MKCRTVLTSLLFLLVLLSACGGQKSTSTPTLSHQQAIQYLQTALDFIQERSVKIDKIDWANIQSQALAQAKDTQTAAQTYPAIQWTLQQLGDSHSFFLTPEQASTMGKGQAKGFGIQLSYDASGTTTNHFVIEIYPDSPAAKAGVQVGDQVELMNGKVPETNFSSLLQASSLTLTLIHRGQTKPFSVKLTAATYDMNLQPQWRLLDNHIGYIELPTLEGGSMTDKYANIVQQDIASLDQMGIRGWIVDLRLDRGGNMWPMLAGIGPVLGEGRVGSFASASGASLQSWFYSNGKALVGGSVAAQVANPYHLKQVLPPVAVLTSALTGSSGEAVVVAFRARPHTRSFGEPTAGVPTANTSTTLSDGALLVVTVALDADRTGATYDSAIAPDQSVQMNWQLLGSADDSVVQVASTWLQTQ